MVRVNGIEPVNARLPLVGTALLYRQQASKQAPYHLGYHLFAFPRVVSGCIWSALSWEKRCPNTCADTNCLTGGQVVAGSNPVSPTRELAGQSHIGELQRSEIRYPPRVCTATGTAIQSQIAPRMATPSCTTCSPSPTPSSPP